MTWWLVWFGRHGALRYVSHLDTARAVQRTFARAGVRIAPSEGMRPKPRLSLPLPLPVGAEGVRELAVVAVAAEGGDDAGPPDARAALRALRAAAPQGLSFDEIVEAGERPRPQPVAATYECTVGAGVEAVAEAIAAMNAAESLAIERRSPKGVRDVDLTRYIEELTVAGQASDVGATVRFTLRHLRDGSARPDEVVAALCERAATDPVVRDLVRTRVRFEGLPRVVDARATK
jgi:radical SAM-linked protein